MKLFGLIGYPLSHSFSEAYFKKKFAKEKIYDCDYRLFPISTISELIPILHENPELCGFNVTIPYKKEIFPSLTYVDPVAAEIGAVNTVRIIRNEQNIELHGYNTDILGFEYSLTPLLHGRKKALILGTGGAAMAVAYVLKKNQISFQFVSRNPTNDSIAYHQIDQQLLEEQTIIINTSPVGMCPNIIEAPALPYHLLNKKHLLYDLIYNPEITQFIKNGLAQECEVKNGLEMLQIQAEEAWNIFSL